MKRIITSLVLAVGLFLPAGAQTPAVTGQELDRAGAQGDRIVQTAEDLMQTLQNVDTAMDAFNTLQEALGLFGDLASLMSGVAMHDAASFARLGTLSDKITKQTDKMFGKTVFGDNWTNFKELEPLLSDFVVAMANYIEVDYNSHKRLLNLYSSLDSDSGIGDYRNAASVTQMTYQRTIRHLQKLLDKIVKIYKSSVTIAEKKRAIENATKELKEDTRALVDSTSRVMVDYQVAAAAVDAMSFLDLPVKRGGNSDGDSGEKGYVRAQDARYGTSKGFGVIQIIVNILIGLILIMYTIRLIIDYQNGGDDFANRLYRMILIYVVALIILTVFNQLI